MLYLTRFWTKAFTDWKQSNEQVQGSIDTREAEKEKLNIAHELKQ